MKNKILFTPKKQSNWAHIPIGRILEPVGVSNFNNLKKYINASVDDFNHIEKITSMKLIHEKRWYMEERETLKEVFFID